MVFVHLATGFEEVEALTCIDVFRRAGMEVQSVSVTGEKTVIGKHTIKVVSDLLFEDADYSLCDMIVLPGGMPGAFNLKAHRGLAEQIKAFAKANKPLAAICAAPLVLASHGALDGKSATIYPGMEEHIKDARPTGENVTVDGNVITGLGPAIAMEFALTIVEYIKGKEARAEVAKGLLFDRR